MVEWRACRNVRAVVERKRVEERGVVRTLVPSGDSLVTVVVVVDVKTRRQALRIKAETTA